jgi:hypothetical protein
MWWRCSARQLWPVLSRKFATAWFHDLFYVTNVTVLYVKHENNKFRKAQFYIQQILTKVLPGLFNWKVTQIIMSDRQTFINKYFKKTFKIVWSNIISNAELWRHAQQEKPVAV